jgi:hypothetical protein
MTGSYEDLTREQDPYQQLRSELLQLSLSALEEALVENARTVANIIIFHPAAIALSIENVLFPLQSYQLKPTSQITMADETVIAARRLDTAHFSVSNVHTVKVMLLGSESERSVLEFDTARRNIGRDPSTSDMLAAIDSIVFLKTIIDELSAPAE